MNQITIPDVIDSKSSSNLQNFLTQNGLQAYARATGSGNPTIAGSYTATKISLTTKQFAVGIKYDATNHRFSAKTAGTYQVNACAAYVNTSAAEEIDVMIYKNGVQVAIGFNYTPGSIQTGAVVSDMVQLSPGDYIELWTIHSGASRNLVGGSSFLSISKL